MLVDANVLIDVLSENPVWCEWSSDALLLASREEELAVNPLIFSEVCMGYQTIESAKAELDLLSLTYLELPYESAWLAGQAFLKYKQRGGSKRSPLPDFYIGAHALVKGLTLLTRDIGRYQSYFPGLNVISP